MTHVYGNILKPHGKWQQQSTSNVFTLQTRQDQVRYLEKLCYKAIVKSRVYT